VHRFFAADPRQGPGRARAARAPASSAALGTIVSENLDARRSAVEQAEAIIDTQVGQFMHWIKVRETVPLIRQLREHAEETRRQELDRALKALARGEDPAAVLESLSQGLTNKLLHAPTQALKKPK